MPPNHARPALELVPTPRQRPGDDEPAARFHPALERVASGLGEIPVPGRQDDHGVTTRHCKLAIPRAACAQGLRKSSGRIKRILGGFTGRLEPVGEQHDDLSRGADTERRDLVECRA